MTNLDHTNVDRPSTVGAPKRFDGLTLLVLVAWVGRSVAPAAVGQPYDPEHGE